MGRLCAGRKEETEVEEEDVRSRVDLFLVVPGATETLGLL